MPSPTSPHPPPPADAPWYGKGLPFACTLCGRCCTARGEYQYVYVSLRERRALASFLRISTAVFTRTYTTRDGNGYPVLKFLGEACIFLEGKLCRVHSARPTQCRTWPFWPELLVSPEVYEAEVRSFCPGSRTGPRIPAAEIERQAAETGAALEEDGN
ncbi:MAG: YkgJ family cysteine cluster protein [Planctomycetota bacterium]